MSTYVDEIIRRIKESPTEWTVKKMEGLAVYRTNLRNWAFFDGHDRPTGNDKNAILTIFDGPRKRLFTEDEVKAMAKRAVEAYVNSSAMLSEFMRDLPGMIECWASADH